MSEYLFKPPIETAKIADYEDEVFYGQLRQFPPELAQRHITFIEAESLNDEEAGEYLLQQLALREQAVQVMGISDESLAEAISSEAEFFEHIRSTLFEDSESIIGHGTTSKICQYRIADRQLAIKYVVTPKANTRSAASEHNVIREFERMCIIESLESESESKHPLIKTPHPQFHFKDARIQCYGMEQIKGNGFDQILGNTASDANMESFRESQLSEASLEDILEQVEEFFRTMHSYCIHGSLKADNIMLSTSGEIYIIDFGDSTLLSETEQITPEQLATNMDDEIKITKQLVTSVYRKVFDTESAALAA